MPNQFTGDTRWETFEDSYIPEPNSGCWLWLGGRNSSGYGVLRNPLTRRGIQAHRAAWLKFKGEVPEGLQVLHRCDVPACVNPDHLFLGTHTENMQDMTKKGRHPYKRGQSHPNAVLTEDDVRAIRASDENYTSLGRRYGICKNNVYLIRARQAWGHVP
jgi:hypothetical protein